MNDHLNELDAQLDELERIERAIREAMANMPVMLRKIRARSRAIRRDLTPLRVLEDD